MSLFSLKLFTCFFVALDFLLALGLLFALGFLVVFDFFSVQVRFVYIKWEVSRFPDLIRTKEPKSGYTLSDC